jgi:hypothetical protein
MNELENGWPSMVPRTFTSPFVPKTSTDRGQTAYVQPPGVGLFWSVASNSPITVRPPLASVER